MQNVVDVQARKTAMEMVTRFFIRRETTNLQYMDEFPRSQDPAVKAIMWMLWGLYDDLREHKMDGNHRLTPDILELVSRCTLFLRTEREYEWDPSVGSIKRTLKYWVFRFRNRHRYRRPLSFAKKMRLTLFDEPEGAAEVWPFYRVVDYEEARQQFQS